MTPPQRRTTGQSIGSSGNEQRDELQGQDRCVVCAVSPTRHGGLCCAHRYDEQPRCAECPPETAGRRPLRVNGKPIPRHIANGSPGDFARFCGETDPAVLAILDAETESD